MHLLSDSEQFSKSGSLLGCFGGDEVGWWKALSLEKCELVTDDGVVYKVVVVQSDETCGVLTGDAEVQGCEERVESRAREGEASKNNGGKIRWVGVCKTLGDGGTERVANTNNVGI